MEFDVSRVYTAVNADELKVGSKVLVADNLEELRTKVELDAKAEVLLGIEPDNRLYRFRVHYARSALAYLAEAPIPLKWTDLKVGDVIRSGWRTRMVTGIDNDSSNIHVVIGDLSLDDYDLREWEKVEQ